MNAIYNLNPDIVVYGTAFRNMLNGAMSKRKRIVWRTKRFLYIFAELIFLREQIENCFYHEFHDLDRERERVMLDVKYIALD